MLDGPLIWSSRAALTFWYVVRYITCAFSKTLKERNQKIRCSMVQHTLGLSSECTDVRWCERSLPDKTRENCCQAELTIWPRGINHLQQYYVPNCVRVHQLPILETWGQTLYSLQLCTLPSCCSLHVAPSPAPRGTYYKWIFIRGLVRCSSRKESIQKVANSHSSASMRTIGSNQ